MVEFFWKIMKNRFNWFYQKDFKYVSFICAPLSLLVLIWFFQSKNKWLIKIFFTKYAAYFCNPFRVTHIRTVRCVILLKNCLYYYHYFIIESHFFHLFDLEWFSTMFVGQLRWFRVTSFGVSFQGIKKKSSVIYLISDLVWINIFLCIFF